MRENLWVEASLREQRDLRSWSPITPSPECPARKSGDEWRGEPSEALAKEGYGYGEFRIPIRMPRAGARGASLDGHRLHFLERGVAKQGLLNSILQEGGHTLFNGSL